MFTETVEQVDEGLAQLLGAVRAGELTAARLKELIAVSRSWEAKVTALQTDAARLIAQQESHGDGGASVLRDQAGKSKSQARRSLGTAEALDEMPGLRAAVDAGEVALANAERLADAAQRTAPETVDSASDLLAMAKELSPDKFAREASAWTQRHQSDHGHGDWLDKRRQRYLKTWRQKDGSVRLDGLLDPEVGTRICNRLQNTAEQLRRHDQQTARANVEDSTGPGGSVGGEGLRSWDQLRADALDLLTSGDAEGPKTGGGGRPKAEIIAVADIGVLTGENPAGRCEISGAGPVPPEVLERIACDAQLTGVIFADGKPALQPPNPLDPPNPADGRHPDDTRDARASRPHPPPGGRGGQHARPGGGTGARISPLASEIRARDRTRRPDNTNAHQRQTQKASGPDPPPQTPALFTT